tara:strand:- start:821 stop:1675 length:855 start_codon:yes stop_codon:yes gene_type:complete
MGIDENIINVFDNMSYSEQYNYDIWFTIIAIIIVLVLTIYFYIDNFIKSQRPNWKNNKCNPLYMPFASALAGSVDADGNQIDPSGNFAEKNFNECLNDLTFGISLDVKQPINVIFGIFKNMFAFLASIVSQIVAFFMYLLNLVFQLFNALVERLKLILHQVNIVLIRGNTFLQNISYSLQDIYFTVVVGVELLKTLIGASLNVMATTFLVGGISQFAAVLSPLIVFITIASILSGSFFLAFLAAPFWVLVAIYTILLLISLAVMIIGILLNLKVGEFLRGMLFG